MAVYAEGWTEYLFRLVLGSPGYGHEPAEYLKRVVFVPVIVFLE